MSSGPSGLQRLTDERENILLAEVAALLHDIGKFCNRHIEHECGGMKWWHDDAYKIVVDNARDTISWSKSIDAIDKPRIVNVIRRNESNDPTSEKAAKYLRNDIKEALQNSKIDLLEHYSLAELIMLGLPGFAAHQNRAQLLDGKDGWLPALLGVCHSDAHHDKQEPSRQNPTHAQRVPSVLVSSPFGHEFQTFIIGDVKDSLDAHLKNLPVTQSTLTSRNMMNQVLTQFSIGLGDTRRPINEVTLADWSESVTALFKAAVAAVFLTSTKPEIRQWLGSPRDGVIDHEIRWRLLRISFNGLAFLERAPSVPDLLGRQQALKDAIDRVKHLLEYKYPLGNEVYRDENGSAFVVPALDGDDDSGTKLRGLVETKVRDAFREPPLRGELEPCLSVTKASRSAATLHKELEKRPQPPHAFVDAVHTWWQGEAADICTVCGLRPQGWGAPSPWYLEKSQRRNVCYVCLERRGRRAQEWANPDGERWRQTIWLDEVSDVHGKVALLVGRFDLDRWLNGEMVRSMLVICDPDNTDPKRRFVDKNPSFARLQRIWRTTQRFWQDVLDKDIPAVVGANRLRLVICPGNAAKLNDELGGYHVYDVDLGGVRASLVWDPERKVLITASGLPRLTRRLGADRQNSSDPHRSAEYVKTHIPRRFTLYEPGGYGERRSEAADVDVDPGNICIADPPYSPLVRLLEEPSSFMALVPANKAVEALRRIKSRFECEMGKVRNRLPFFLGAVFFDYHQPLFAALDAGRRMLKQELEWEDWTVSRNPSETDGRSLVAFQTGVKWSVPTVMGDGSTPDHWYPYYRVMRSKDGNPPSSRRKHFKLIMKNGEFEAIPGSDVDMGEDSARVYHWVHVDELQPGDVVQVTPARFAHLHLDTSGRRFEVGRRPLQYLERIERMQDLWQRLKGLRAQQRLTDSKLHALEALFRSKWEEWSLDKEPANEALQTFKELVEATLKQEGLSDTIQSTEITDGLFFDVMEVFYHIMRERLATESINSSVAREEAAHGNA